MRREDDESQGDASLSAMRANTPKLLKLVIRVLVRKEHRIAIIVPLTGPELSRLTSMA